MSAPRRALLTGASSGIGAALAAELARRGVALHLAARRADRLAGVVNDIARAGGVARAVSLDVTDVKRCAAAVAALDEEVGGFDIVIANAGVGGRTTSVWATSIDDAQETVATNLTGALATILPLLPRMRDRGRGHVVGISSMAAELPQPQAAVYGATKAGLSFFLESVTPELERCGLTVTIVQPGFVKSEMTAKNRFPMPFILETDDAARRIADAIDGRRRWLRFPRALVATIAAASMLPGGMRARLARSAVPDANNAGAHIDGGGGA